jgi:hypothetical protein
MLCYARLCYATSLNWNNEEGTTVTSIDANADPTSFLLSSSAAVLTKMHCRPISLAHQMALLALQYFI